MRKNEYNGTREIEEKITSIFTLNGSQYEPVDHLEAGEIGIVYGLNNARIGDVLGNSKNLKKHHKLATPTLTVRVYPLKEEKLDDLLAAFRLLEEEDPLLNVQWLDNERELHVQLMGMVQMEILTGIIKNRFNLHNRRKIHSNGNKTIGL